ncbi:hypothetical protein EXS74_01750 [Candidatus Woesearchaeota archaeon]|nr:hypothetical protein [Candidatus Woesearchaeota archaeon]
MNKKSIFLILISILLINACSTQTEETNDYGTDDTCPPAEEYLLYYGESIDIGDHTVTIQDINDAAVDVDVDGSSSYIGTGSYLEINQVTIAPVSTDTQEPIELSSTLITLYC